jgi:hypothetical protein
LANRRNGFVLAEILSIHSRQEVALAACNTADDLVHRNSVAAHLSANLRQRLIRDCGETSSFLILLVFSSGQSAAPE